MIPLYGRFTYIYLIPPRRLTRGREAVPGQLWPACLEAANLAHEWVSIRSGTKQSTRKAYGFLRGRRITGESLYNDLTPLQLLSMTVTAEAATITTAAGVTIASTADAIGE